MKNTCILYLTYDGLLEPLGQSQVFNYLKNLSAEFKIIVISFERQSDLQKPNNKKLIQEIKSSGLIWIPLRYHNHPKLISKIYDILHGILIALWVQIKYQPRLVHARSYIPSMIAIIIKLIFKSKFIFDMRGFWADEKVDKQLWTTHTLVYKLFKYLEKLFINKADYIVTVTESGKELVLNSLAKNPQQIKIKVIPTCVDLNIFHIKKHINPIQKLTLGWIGSVNQPYLIEDALSLYKKIKTLNPKITLRIYNNGQRKIILENAKKINLASEEIFIKEVNHFDIPKEVQKIDFGIILAKPTLAKLGSFPTKFGEFIASGVPCLMNDSIPDLSKIIKQYKCGIIINEFNSYSQIYSEMKKLAKDKSLAARCRKVAETKLSLGTGVEEYKKIYLELINEK